jgi:hypothetical protein
MAKQVTDRLPSLPPGKLWFGLAGSAIAWTTLGVGDVLITWWACVQDQPLGGGTARTGAGLLYVAITLLLFTLSVAAGILSYRNWRRLSGARGLLHAEAQERQEFVALLGVVVSVTLGFGLVWLTIPLLILKLCVRAR